ncbi:putative FMN-binding domain-containing protein [Lipomyces tetrasporus]|uniref:FMN-binding domain-containing protein n=1 Tax=Lipomyces tetrasporus TaxID=54092 RepID=A0AAD7R0N0_9ASCO|nr:putative FMN-binding domain-containing protein [Lipomyces tetrasporus]KAJ8103442.1 putative FMN-binding domain-containing protein [Lipomyces tetrasporus]
MYLHTNPLGILTTAIRSSSHPLLQSSHIPWILDVKSNDSETELKVLVTLQLVHHYVTPKFYTETKPTSGKVVPTCDYYSAVQVYGAARIYFDTRSKQQLSDLSLHAEKSIMGYGAVAGPRRWEVSDAPISYIDLQEKNIIGVEEQIKSMTGKFKMNRDGVIKSFEGLNSAAGAQDLQGRRGPLASTSGSRSRD